MSPKHKRVLIALDDMTSPYGEYCVGFKPLARELDGMTVPEIRRVVRHLARKGMAEFFRGLITDEGEFADSGYCISQAGRSFLISEVSHD